MKEAFVYRWRNTQTKQWYVGYHKGTPDDGYICSSIIARPLIASNPTEWSRKILRFGSKQEMIGLERRILKGLNAKNNSFSLNRSNGGASRYSSIDILGYNLNHMSAYEIALKYKEEIDSNNKERRLAIEEWLLNKVFFRNAK